MNYNALLALEDGVVFKGISIGAEGSSVGEVVFNTSMTGYQEILTDPSYAKQIVTLTYPHIGNVGVNSEDEEAVDIFSAGLVIKNLPHARSNWRSRESLSDYLKRRNVVAIANIDTRRLTRHLRVHGAQGGCIATGKKPNEAAALTQAKAFPGLGGMDLAEVVSVSDSYHWNSCQARGKGDGVWQLESGHSTATSDMFKVIAYDFGIKHNILRLLSDRGCDVTVVPARTPASETLAHKPDGVFLSNGPGDPEPCGYAVDAIGEILSTGIPVFGICLGHQLLCLASGARTEKMKFGHHGANHPVQDLQSKRVYITSQNHGFTVNESSLPDNLEITHRSLFDHTVQGVARTDLPAFSFQGHPEASPGPNDINTLFDHFQALMQQHKSATVGSGGDRP